MWIQIHLRIIYAIVMIFTFNFDSANARNINSLSAFEIVYRIVEDLIEKLVAALTSE